MNIGSVSKTKAMLTGFESHKKLIKFSEVKNFKRFFYHIKIQKLIIRNIINIIDKKFKLTTKTMSPPSSCTVGRILVSRSSLIIITVSSSSSLMTVEETKAYLNNSPLKTCKLTFVVKVELPVK